MRVRRTGPAGAVCLLYSFCIPAHLKWGGKFSLYDCIIIGCGIIGAAAAYELSKYRLNVAVLEKGNDVAMGTTRANSAIIHAGYDPEPGTVMARLNVEGNRLAAELAGKLDIPYKAVGSLVLAFDETDLGTIQHLYENGVANGVPDIRLLSAEETLAMEPHLSREVKGALYAPSAGIVSPWEYALALAETAVRNGVELHLDSDVTAIEALPEGGWRLATSSGVYEAKAVINAAGVHSDAVHNLAVKPDFKIIPNRGEYYLLDKSEGTRVSHVIFQCPSAVGKGVLVSPTIHGNLIVGPNAEDVGDGDNTACTASGLEFVMNTARRSVPDINFRDSIRNFAGVRAVSDQPDFIIQEAAPRFIDLAGIKSPGLSAAPAIAIEAAGMLEKSGIALEKKDSFIDERRRVRFSELTPEEKNELIKENPLYGRVICRCETVTEGEIVAALHTPIPPRSVDGVKRRVNAGMGRCQGGFCGPRVVEILSREGKVPPTEVLQDGVGTNLLTGETKMGGRE